ncbi:FGGY family carbohydrate kinase [Sphingobium sp. HBC34]|uniref:FGGY family carbohydrate kinase n=1 Tax=Sphingobium cyanobacteriorum TaxID=3063954 RepID=A0ABT8ZT22_9SPHN|nr:FGGY family carbohydrate kinase [Sphingobium sp. HBC34]MDO7836621.1 FGGY family carbohydrate kinase [Sphingobium sp. HBC34]
MDTGVTVVIDLGKTLSKVSLWDRAGQMLDRQVRPNRPIIDGGLRRLDADGIGDWLIECLSRYSGHPVQRIIPVGHGAGVAALIDGRLAFAPLDYEQAIPDDILAAYRAERDPFAITGSPALPAGLNIGSQLYWLQHLYPRQMAEATLLPWAQYWAWFLTGRAVSEVTSLGCHSDVWSPAIARFSPMATRLGWADRFAPLVGAGDIVGPISDRVANATGLPAGVSVLAGLHDSNAALLAARGYAGIDGQEATVLSTGTWFIAMRLTPDELDLAALPEARDCLVNVDAYGSPVPSARFMGGREIETVIEIDTRQVDIKPDQPLLRAAVPTICANGSMILPTLAPGAGPFPHGHADWVNRPDDWIERRAAACLYAALVADVSLDLIGTREQLLIEGRFAAAEVFVRALASLRPDLRIYIANAQNDVSFGALRLINPALRPDGQLVRAEPLPCDLGTYRHAWRAAIADRNGGPRG